MDRITITTNLTPQVTIDEVRGHLQIKGWVRSEVFAKTSTPGALKHEETEDGVRLSCSSDLVLRLPREATLKVGKVHGSLRAKYLDRRLDIEVVSGSLGLRQVRDIHIDTVKGDVLIKQALGGLQIGEISGSAILRDVQGTCHLERVAGNLDIREARSDLLVSAGGHVNIQVGWLAGNNYRISCGKNLHCQVPEDASVQVHLSSEAHEISVVNAEQSKAYNQSQYDLTMGEGDASMDLAAGGKLLFTTTEPEWRELDDFDQVLNEEFTRLSEELTNQIESQIEAHMKTLNGNMDKLAEDIQNSGIPAELSDRLVWRVRASSDRATARAQEKMRWAQEKIERKLATAQQKADMGAREAQESGGERRHRSWRMNWTPAYKPGRPTPENPTHESVIHDERLAVLRMLEQKKITSEEAEKLLSALEGSNG